MLCRGFNEYIDVEIIAQKEEKVKGGCEKWENFMGKCGYPQFAVQHFRLKLIGFMIKDLTAGMGMEKAFLRKSVR